MSKEEICENCGKTGVRAKKMCRACYQRKMRQTPKGKASLKLYNDTKGKIAQQKHRSKKPKKITVPKKPCECGKESIAKNMCRNCYQKKHNEKNPNYKPRAKNEIDFTPTYEKVLDKVKKGNTIEVSCKLVGVERTKFYKKITPVQKQEIRSYKATFNKATQHFGKQTP